ncbi:MAG: amidohydrolase family protein, partial [Pseudorhodobacter sp.]|nr:amidohydrolase family protein [Pseudorhodobacter sp.]
LRFGNTPDQFLALHQAAESILKSLPPDTVLGLAPHSLRAVTPHGLTLATTLGGPIHIHIAEQQAEVAELLNATNQRPVDWLLTHHDVNHRWCLIHATQMEPQETLAVAHTQAIAGLCPITEANLGDGIFDGQRFVQANGRFGIGSDSNVKISLIEELRLLEYSQRLAQKGRAILATADKSTGRTLYDGAVQGGAQAAARPAGIAPGNWADLLHLTLQGPDLQGVQGDTILDTFIFAGCDRLITDLWSAGRHLVQNGQHHARAQVQTRYAKTVARLRGAL